MKLINAFLQEIPFTCGWHVSRWNLLYVNLLTFNSRLDAIFQTECNIQTIVVELRLSQPRLLKRKFSSRLINRAFAD